MLHRVAFSNFYSFESRAELSFVMDGRTPESERCFISPATGNRLSKVLAVFGPNGGGKTNAIKPLAFLADFLTNSFRSEPDADIAVQKHFFSKQAETTFELEFEIPLGGKPTLLLYKLTLTPQRVVSEELLQKTSARFSYLFVRIWNEESGSYSIRQKDFGLPKKQAESVRQNASLISTAEQFSVPIAVEIASYMRKRSANLNVMGRHMFGVFPGMVMGIEIYRKDEALRQRMVSLLREWDIGLQDIIIKKVEMTGPDGQQKESFVPFGVHRLGDQEAELPLMAESSGTQGAFGLLASLLPVLANGGFSVIDEIESDLHPLMLRPILDLLFNKSTNQENSQVIFTCHSAELMNQLQKGQIYFVEKDDESRSQAWSLADMDVRQDENFAAKYLAGAYGAIPRL